MEVIGGIRKLHEFFIKFASSRISFGCYLVIFFIIALWKLIYDYFSCSWIYLHNFFFFSAKLPCARSPCDHTPHPVQL